MREMRVMDENIRPEGEDAQFLHDVKFPSLVEMEDVPEETGIPIKIKLLLLHVIVVTHLQDGGGSEEFGATWWWI